MQDVAHTLKLLSAVDHEQWFNPAGSDLVPLPQCGPPVGFGDDRSGITPGPKPIRVLFSGDVGRYRAPLYHDPARRRRATI
jgi:hypothetical protein